MNNRQGLHSWRIIFEFLNMLSADKWDILQVNFAFEWFPESDRCFPKKVKTKRVLLAKLINFITAKIILLSGTLIQYLTGWSLWRKNCNANRTSLKVFQTNPHLPHMSLKVCADSIPYKPFVLVNDRRLIICSISSIKHLLVALKNQKHKGLLVKHEIHMNYGSIIIAMFFLCLNV